MTHLTPKPNLSHDYSRIVEIYSLYGHFLKAHNAKNICIIKIEHEGSIKDFDNHNNQDLLRMGKRIKKIHILSLDKDLYHLQYSEYFEDQISTILTCLKQYDLVAAHNLDFQVRLIEYLMYKHEIPKYFPDDHQKAFCTMELGSKITDLHIYRNGKKTKKRPSLKEVQRKLNMYYEINSSQDYLLGVQECLFHLLFRVSELQIEQ